jgi:hypothetical protein
MCSGAYVKEFVHGDLGRTRPSIASLLKGRVSNDDDDSLFILRRILTRMIFINMVFVLLCLGGDFAIGCDLVI